MKTRRTQTLIAAALVGALVLTNAQAQQTSAPKAPNMPAADPWLTDSVYPTTHFNPARPIPCSMRGRPRAAR